MPPSDRPYIPIDHFAAAEGAPRPSVFASPGRYLQGRGILDRLGRDVAALGSTRVALLMSDRRARAVGARILASLDAAAIAGSAVRFGGECSLEAIERHSAEIRALPAPVDGLIAIGGGKAIDTGKAVADRLGVPLVVVPTLASTDAPCSAVAVLYTPDGADAGAEFYARSPALVAVDTGVIAAAGERFLVAGIGDALSTPYEARAVAANPVGAAVIGGRPTQAGLAIAEACGDALFAHGLAAARAAADGRVDAALERIVETNTLLSGLGFESGGLAAAHAVAQGCTAVPALRERFLHGEHVALGTLTQLQLEGDRDEALRVAALCADLGLPIHLGQLGLGRDDRAERDALVSAALAYPPLTNMPTRVTASALHAALLAAHDLGREVAAERGDAAYRRLHGLSAT